MLFSISTTYAEKGCVEIRDFHMAVLVVLPGPGIKARTHASVDITHLPNLDHHQALKSTQPAAFCFPGPDDASHWEMCGFPMGMGSCFKPG